MHNQSLVSYSAIVKGFQKSHRRGVRVFEMIYGDVDDRLLQVLIDREWHRFYIYKRAVRYLEKHVPADLAKWLLETERGQHLLGGSVRKLCGMTPQAAHRWLVSLTTTNHWG